MFAVYIFMFCIFFYTGPVNLGSAIQYAIDNLLTTEAGMRENRVPKIIIIKTDRNAEDDFEQAVEEARKRGIIVS